MKTFSPSSYHKLRTLRLAAVSAFVIGATTVGVEAYAGTATSNLSVGATVATNCTITTTAVTFGSYDPVSANAAADLDAAGAVNVNCTSGSAATITLGQGSNADTGSTDAAPVRRMKDAGTDYLTYQLYSDSGRSAVWENVTGVSHTGTGAAVAVSVYGRVTSAQNVPAGTYADTVVATVTF